MKLASHNTMSYLKPQWWVRPFAFMARCQSKDIYEQYKAGARMFDLRVTFDDNGTPYFAHGLASYKDYDVDEILRWIRDISREYQKETGERIVVRVFNERNDNVDIFDEFCHEIYERFGRDIQFCGFHNKNCQYYVNIPLDDVEYIDKYASNNCQKHNNGNCTGRWYDDLCPWIYAWLHNKKNRRKFETTDGFLMQDFIGVY